MQPSSSACKRRASASGRRRCSRCWRSTSAERSCRRKARVDARAAGLELVAWSLERSGPLRAGHNGWYYQTIDAALRSDSDVLIVLDVLARQAQVRAVFSDWPATTTFYANCTGLN